MLILNKSFSRALSVLTLLQGSEKLQTSDILFDVKAYQNGREQGIMIIKNYFNVWYVSEHRTSDSMVVYNGSYETSGLHETAYNNAKFFRSIEEVVEFLEKELLYV